MRQVIRLYHTNIWLTPLLLLMSVSCRKFIDVSAPVTGTNSANVYTDDATAAAVLTGIYTNLSKQDIDLGSGGITGASLYPSLAADDLTLYNTNDTRYAVWYRNDLTSQVTSGLFWSNIYPLIFDDNSAIQGLNASKAVSAPVRQQLMGEAYFMRAFFYFYLVNFYGDVPLVTGVDYKVNSTLPRTPRADVYKQVVTDLKVAAGLLSADWLDASASKTTTTRVRPTKWAAEALLARVYLYLQDWPNAETYADSVIQSGKFSLVPLGQAFLSTSSEAIWQLQPVGVNTQSNTGEGALFILPAAGPNTSNFPLYLSHWVMDAFEPGDQRRVNWVDSVAVGAQTYYYPYKYKIPAVNTPTKEYIMVLRLAEQFLIRAEARAEQQNISGAQDDLNAVRTRAGLGPTAAGDLSSLLDATLHERQVELFTEWGNRWFDLQRTGKLDGVMTTVAPEKGGDWAGYKALFPLPLNELLADPNLKQNTGYN